MPRILLAALAAVVLIAACGGGDGALSKADYQKQFNAASTKFGTNAKQLANPSGKAPASERAAAGEKAADAIGAFVDELAALEPPHEVAQAHSDLTAAFRESGDLTRQAARKLRAGDKKGLEQVAAKLRGESDKQKQAAKALKTFSDKGYRLDLDFGLN
jgi:ElaB/YqjD/DUF883 family membrane-anchored ribosome-binding protein